MNVNYKAANKVFEVEVTHKVYVVAESKEKAMQMVARGSASAWEQSKEHALYSTDEITKISSVDKERIFDRPLGSDKKVLSEILV